MKLHDKEEISALKPYNTASQNNSVINSYYRFFSHWACITFFLSSRSSILDVYSLDSFWSFRIILDLSRPIIIIFVPSFLSSFVVLSNRNLLIFRCPYLPHLTFHDPKGTFWSFVVPTYTSWPFMIPREPSDLSLSLLSPSDLSWSLRTLWTLYGYFKFFLTFHFSFQTFQTLQVSSQSFQILSNSSKFFQILPDLSQSF